MRAGATPLHLAARFGDPGAPADTLARWYRTGWIPLVGGCVVIAGGIIAFSEWALVELGQVPNDPGLRAFFIGRAIVTSMSLALWSGAFVLRSRRRLERVRDQLRAQRDILVARAWAAEQDAGIAGQARILAHEVRGPLHVIALNFNILNKKLAELPENRSAQFAPNFDTIGAEIARLGGLLDEYIEQSAEANAPRFQDAVDFAELVRRAASAHTGRLAANGVRCELDLAADLPRISADPDRLEQALSGLLRQAVESLAEGGIVRVHVARAGTGLELTIADNGPAFEDPAAVFRPFHAAHGRGSGLMFLAVLDTVRAHGGEVSARNAGPLGGSQVMMRLPVAAPAKQPSGNPQ